MQHAFSHSPMPRYVQLADVFRQQIACGAWKAGDRLPSNEELARRYDVARGTVREALQLLEREQLVEARQGRGSFVTGTIKEERWIHVQSSLAELAKFYRETKPQMLVLQERMESAPLREGDGTPAPRYVYMRRVHSRNEEPYCLIDIYVDEALFRRMPDRFRTEPVIPLLTGARPSAVERAHQTLTLGGASLEVAEHLRVPVNSPVANVRRVFANAQGRVTYLALVTYRGDVIQIDMDLRP